MKLTEDMQDNFNVLIHQFSNPNPYFSNKACKQLTELWNERFVEWLMLNLDSDDIELRRKAVNVLGSFGNKVVEPIIRGFHLSNKKIFKISCFKVLIKAAQCEHFNSSHSGILNLIQLALDEDSPEMILTIISLLRTLGKPGLPTLINLSADEDVLKAKASVMAIGEIYDPLSEKCLKELLKNKSIDCLVRSSVLDALNTFKSLKKFK